MDINLMSKRKKKRFKKFVKSEITSILKKDGISQSSIDLFYSKSAQGDLLRKRVRRFFIENGATKENVAEFFKYVP